MLTADGEHILRRSPEAAKRIPIAREPAAPVDAARMRVPSGTLVTYGKFRFIDLGDLTKQKEMPLVCPNNLVGTVDLYLPRITASTTRTRRRSSMPSILAWRS